MRILLYSLCLASSLFAQAPLAVIVQPGSPVKQLSKAEVVNLFLGRQKHLAAGLPALPVDQVSPESTWAEFYRLLVDKELSQINTYWARLHFSGQSRPPRRFQSSEDVLNFVASHPGAIGYVEEGKVDRRVRVVHVLKQ